MISTENILQHYKIYTIRGKSGKKRQIEEPLPELMELQKSINKEINRLATLHPACMAKSSSSIVDNAAVHEGSKFVLRVDIKACYRNITLDTIWKSLFYQPSELRSYLAETLPYCLIPVEDKRQYILPTGAPTSPVLCNIALTPIDHDIAEIATNNHMQYSRYIDDIHLSTKEDMPNYHIMQEIKQLLNSWDLRVNTDKSKWMSIEYQDKIIITGVRISAKYKTPLEFYRKIRAMINNSIMNGTGITQEVQGCLAYIQQIDHTRYKQLQQYILNRQEKCKSLKKEC